ncbi:MAG TPA: hypothetical protein VLL52_12865 [Anaerolineae bacterium]|nr:hypothetical protein [Anaerolineae bacterium]
MNISTISNNNPIALKIISAAIIGTISLFIVSYALLFLFFGIPTEGQIISAIPHITSGRNHVEQQGRATYHFSDNQDNLISITILNRNIGTTGDIIPVIYISFYPSLALIHTTQLELLSLAIFGFLVPLGILLLINFIIDLQTKKPLPATDKRRKAHEKQLDAQFKQQKILPIMCINCKHKEVTYSHFEEVNKIGGQYIQENHKKRHVKWERTSSSYGLFFAKCEKCEKVLSFDPDLIQ